VRRAGRSPTQRSAGSHGWLTSVATNGLLHEAVLDILNGGSLSVGDVHDFDRSPSAPSLPVSDDCRIQCGCVVHALATCIKGQRGFGFVRARVHANRAHQLRRSAGSASTLSEKKPLNHFLPGLGGAVVRPRRLCTLACNSARTGYLPGRGRPTHSPIAPRRQHRRVAGRTGFSAMWLSRSQRFRQSLGDRRTSRRLPERCIMAISVTAGTFAPHACRVLFGNIDRVQRRPEGVHRRFLHPCLLALADVLDTLVYLRTNRRVGGVTTLRHSRANDAPRNRRQWSPGSGAPRRGCAACISPPFHPTTK